MGTRALIMVSIMLLEIAGGISGLVAIDGEYRYRMDSAGIAGCVMVVFSTIVACLLTVAFFLRKSSRAKAASIIQDARIEAAKILSVASDKALALCSLDGGKCQECGNPRTGKF